MRGNRRSSAHARARSVREFIFHAQKRKAAEDLRRISWTIAAAASCKVGNIATNCKASNRRSHCTAMACGLRDKILLRFAAVAAAHARARSAYIHRRQPLRSVDRGPVAHAYVRSGGAHARGWVPWTESITEVRPHPRGPGENFRIGDYAEISLLKRSLAN